MPRIDFLSIITAGFFSCIALDMFGRLLLILFKIPEPSWGIVGRWFFYMVRRGEIFNPQISDCLLYTSPSPRDTAISRMPSSA